MLFNFFKKKQKYKIVNNFETVLQQLVRDVVRDLETCHGRPEVLDIGAGNQSAADALEPGSKYIALDKMRIEKEKKPKGVEMSFIEKDFFVGDSVSELSNKRFDIVLLSRLHIKGGDRARIYKKAFSLVKPHGVMVIAGYFDVKDDLTYILSGALGIDPLYAHDSSLEIRDATENLMYADKVKVVDMPCELSFNTYDDLAEYVAFLYKKDIAKKYGFDIPDLDEADQEVKNEVEAEFLETKEKVGNYIKKNASVIKNPLRQIYKARIVKRG